MAKASIKKQEPKRDEVEFGPKAEKNIEINSINNIENNETNLEDLKNILQDLKNVLTNLGVNISELEVSLASDKNEEKNCINTTNSSNFTWNRRRICIFCNKCF